ncbi:MAG: hypothetical protein HC923_11585 [Myxococcales bacterium]|nr:hypothetical protein [Myxococcales bacterium]
MSPTLFAAALIAQATFQGASEATIVADLADQKLQMQEQWTFRVDAAAPPGSVALPFPAAATAVRLGEDEETFVVDMSAKRVVNPGELGTGRKKVFFSYELPMTSRDLSLRFEKPSFPVLGIRFAAPVIPGLRVEPSAPSSRTSHDFQGVPFELIDVLEPFNQATSVAFDLRGLPVKPTWPRNLAVAVSIALILATIFLLVRQSSERDVPRPELAARRERLVQALQILDEERGGLEETAYSKRRDTLIEQLADVLRQEAR